MQSKLLCIYTPCAEQALMYIYTPYAEKALREHPFNLKWGAMVFFGVKIFVFASLAQQNFFFATSYRDIIFFLQKQSNLQTEIN